MELARLGPKMHLSPAKAARKQAATKESLWPDWLGGTALQARPEKIKPTSPYSYEIAAKAL